MRCSAAVVMFALLLACGSSESQGAGASSESGASAGAGGSASCDGQDDCGDQNDPPTGCFACAERGPCKPSIDACAANAECLSAATCIEQCLESACVTACGEAHPEGEALLIDIVFCIFCGACPADCKTDTSQCP
jgi:hypothetical protein